jgi:hypothetical protein
MLQMTTHFLVLSSTLVGNGTNYRFGGPGAEGRKVADVNVRGGSDVGLGGMELDEMVTREMIKDAHQHITEYLMQNPLLGSLSGLFDTFNMNDPTKV